ncbi:cytochrome P450 monooxygenase-like protein [Plenodomus tracheiphilus IPT5]|uniref:Cytochrome P450 monooxygenase-like protein n=1 Tax=Plenodomus tracheiphilus IPT5 TaxID=1408161 RepID=A0A6A7AY95_9PLEO|nr:cytochrome P450 monooxygenase-like protein [Plenodomus tracheiphilus IPT5]
MTVQMDSLPVDFHVISLKGVVVSVGSFVALSLVYFLGTAIYNVFFHPLKHIPGPLSARISGVPIALRMRTGNVLPWIRAQHEKYGDAVRVAPNEITFISAETAWPDIYGFRTGKYKKTGAYLKDKTWFAKSPNNVATIFTSNEADHSRMRRNLSHAFSDKALRAQEPLIQSYVDLFVQRVGEHGKQGKTIDIMRWYNYATFDIIADLAFGVSLHCLRDSNNHTWINLVFSYIKAAGYLSTRAKFPLFALYDKLSALVTSSRSKTQARIDFFNLARSQVSARVEKGVLPDRNDFFNFILQNQEKEAQKLTRGEMDNSAVSFLIAGSETTATTLSGVTYLLLSNAAAYRKLVQEIRSTFMQASDITMEAVNNLEYLIACFQESLRMYPPVPTGLPRVVPQGGDNISGFWVEGGTAVYVSQHATNHSSRNFKDADVFVPERWLGDERYEGDRREVLNPFSFGPRNCLGKNLAYAEMRLILAKLLFNFDLELVDKTSDWMGGQKVFTLWEKPGLVVNVLPIRT